MRTFHSIFYQNNKSIIYTLIMYALSTVILSAVLIIGGKHNPHFIQAAGLTVLTAFMSFRAAYFIFEKVSVDMEKREIRLHILHKRIPVDKVTSVRKVRTGQIRIILDNNRIIPVSVDDEETFISMLQTINNNIVTLK